MQPATDKPERKKPFQNCKPRHLWKAPLRKLKRMVEIQFGVDKEGEPVYKLVEFSLAKEGLVIRKKHSRKRSVMPYAILANGVGGGQMELL